MSQNQTRRVVVAGGGTAGWLTALMVQRTIPNSDVVVVQSNEIGILGAGEGTTIQFVRVLDYLGIPMSRLIKDAAATFKNGIKFTNWTPESGYFYHNFPAHNPSSIGEVSSRFGTYNETYMLNVARDVHPGRFDFCSTYSDLCKVPFYKVNTPEVVDDPILNYQNFAFWGVHFNAKKLAETLENIAVERGIKVINANIIDLSWKDNGDLDAIILEHETHIYGDFFFDCTGFRSFIIGNRLASKWKSHGDKLTVNKAIPFFNSYEENEVIPPYTESIAMKYGWMWKIPVEDRYGMGYVFDNNFITPDEAKKEVEDYLGKEIDVIRTINFTAGYYKTPWVKNVMAVGLSAGFIEPLEATSILVSILSLEKALDNYGALFYRNQTIIDKFNLEMNQINDEIADFIYFHYMSGRTDTDFWKKYQKINNAPERVQTLLKEWETDIPNLNQFTGKIFPYMSWFQVAYGLKRLNKNLISQYCKESDMLDNLEGFVSMKKVWVDQAKNLINHGDMLKVLRS